MAHATLGLFLESTRARVEHALDAWLPRPPLVPPLVSESMRYSLLAGGKRMRPILTLAAADAVARREAPADERAQAEARDAALPAACAIEWIHTYSLIHDDLPSMDNDSLRRGRPTAHVVFGEGIAILAGDGLQAAAFELLAREPVHTDRRVADRKLRVLAIVARAAGPAGMVGGQAIDLEAAGQAKERTLTLDADALRGMHARKTGAIIRASASCGAIMAGADDGLVDAVDRYAADLGLAFQIVDDILDIEGDAATLGKTAGKDAAGDKVTYPALYGLDRSRALATECIDRCRETLEQARVQDSWLWPIAEWMLGRKN
ncbi:MAG: polyprenyl synthetase family protein [Vicinamibacterales bacterium]